MKIGILKETKTPVDNRVAITPDQIAELKRQYPHAEFVVQSSDIRAYDDHEYENLGIEVRPDISDCDIFFGIKEAKIPTILSNKHYFFFGHIAKMQSYNKPLAQAMVDKEITFSDYEYLVDSDGVRVCAFGWWAGAVGVYYTLRAYGLRTGQFELPKPDPKFTLYRLVATLNELNVDVRVLLTGEGRVSHGAQNVFNRIGAREVAPEILAELGTPKGIEFCVLKVSDLVALKKTDKKTFDFRHFVENPTKYKSRFMEYAPFGDMLISCHFWASNNPVYLDYEDLRNPNMKIKVIGDVTCDINGSIKSTVRPSTHDDPFYDYNPLTQKEEPAFSSKSNITVMAVDTCPNALAIDSSRYFGEQLTEHVFKPILEGRVDTDPTVIGATIVKKGSFTDRFSYLNDFVK